MPAAAGTRARRPWRLGGLSAPRRHRGRPKAPQPHRADRLPPRVAVRPAVWDGSGSEPGRSQGWARPREPPFTPAPRGGAGGAGGGRCLVAEPPDGDAHAAGVSWVPGRAAFPGSSPGSPGLTGMKAPGPHRAVLSRGQRPQELGRARGGRPGAPRGFVGRGGCSVWGTGTEVGVGGSRGPRSRAVCQGRGEVTDVGAETPLRPGEGEGLLSLTPQSRGVDALQDTRGDSGRASRGAKEAWAVRLRAETRTAGAAVRRVHTCACVRGRIVRVCSRAHPHAYRPVCSTCTTTRACTRLCVCASARVHCAGVNLCASACVSACV